MHKYTSRIIVSIGLVVCCQCVQAQRTAPAAYNPAIKVNYIRTWDATAPEQTPATLITRPLRDVRQSTQYFGGLGRPVQTVVKQGSMQTGGSPLDLVSPVVYDVFGREVYRYLPFVANSTGGNASLNDGLFKQNPFQQDSAFNKGQFPGETFYYSKTNYEASPLNRVLEVYAPGNSWAGSEDNTDPNTRRRMSTQYLVNTASDGVRIWTVSGNNFSTGSVYDAGQLYKTVTIDEHQQKTVEYKDKEGQVVLKKVQLDNTPTEGHGGWLCTYYIYDDLHQLRGVIQPRGVELLQQNSWNINALNGDIMNEQCFRYDYDERRRMITKKVPGAGEVYMVYDARDRVAMTQDANMRIANKWSVTLYDELNRPVQTGLLLNTYPIGGTANRTFDQHRTAASTSSEYPFPIASPPATTYWEWLTKTGYDDYTGIPAGLSSTYLNTWDAYFDATNNNTFPYPQMPVQSTATKGLVTWSQVKVLDRMPAVYLASAQIYDEWGRIIQVQKQNITGSTDMTTTQYSWSGQPLITVQKQEIASPAQTTVVVTRMSYDDLGRLTKSEKKLSNTNVNNNAMSAWMTIAVHEYDALGKLKKKKFGSKPGAPTGTALTSLDYEYNIRGWLLSMNKDYITAGSNNDQYFGMQLGYDKNGTLGTFTPQYNGNISGAIWKSEGDQQKRKYDFTYDPLNRLTGADFNQYASGSGTSAVFDRSANVNFTVSNLSYDANGNILTMNQQGLLLNSSSAIDQLMYIYQNNSNKLTRVTDGVAGSDNGKLGDFKDGTNLFSDDYNYDANGNLTLDRNKDISSIRYNILNLPNTITFDNGSTNKGSITYTYDAAGNKLVKTTQERKGFYTSYLTTTYIDGIVYEGRSTDLIVDPNDYTYRLQFIGHEDGRIRYISKHFENGDSAYQLINDYFLKDHLGNVRMVLAEQQDTARYVATMEAAYREKESKLFDNIPATSYPKSLVPGGYPTDGSTTNPNDSLARVNGSGKKVGPSLVLRVMSGDKVDLGVKSFYRPQGSPGPTSDALADILSSLAEGIVGSVGNSKGTLSQLSNTGTSPLLAGLNNFRNSNNPNPTSKPKAYLNWILFDDQFKFVSNSSGAMPVNTADVIEALAPVTVQVSKNGFLYIYVSNETQNWDVFFNDLSVRHFSGPLTEETHYYPFGLTMAGISSQARRPNYVENKKRFNGIELNMDLDINMYDAFYRNLDPQIGRFWQVDPKIESAEAWSPYSGMLNNPIKNTDPLGDSTVPGMGFWYNVGVGLRDGYQSTKSFVKSLGTVQGWKNVGHGLENIGEMMNPGSVKGMMLRYEVVQSGIDAVKNIPNMTADDWGHAVGFGIEKTVEGIVLTKGTGVVTNAIKTSSTTTLFRAVSDAEKLDILDHGVRNIGGSGYNLEKLFATSASDAAQFGKYNFGLDGVPNTIMKFKIPNSIMKNASRFETDGMKAVGIPSDYLDKVQSVGPLNYSPKPTNPFKNHGW